MSRFWVVINLVLFAVFLVVVLVLPALPRSLAIGPEPMARGVFGHAISATLIAMPWAICFRLHLEKGKASLLSLLTLVAMEVVAFWFAEFMQGLSR